MLRINIETENDAFREPGEIARILRGIADNFDTLPTVACGGRLRDANGNVCGGYDFTPGAPACLVTPSRYLVEQEADGGYDTVEVCEFRIVRGQIEIATGDGWESTLLAAGEPAVVEAAARDAAEWVADGDRTIYDPDKPVTVTKFG